MKTIREQQEAGITMFVCMVLALLCIICGVAFGDECQDPEKLSPELKQAYYELKEIAKDTEGMSVKIVCDRIVHDGKIEYIKDIPAEVLKEKKESGK